MKKKQLLLASVSLLVFMTLVFFMGEQQSNAQECNMVYVDHKKAPFSKNCVKKSGYSCIVRCPMGAPAPLSLF